MDARHPPSLSGFRIVRQVGHGAVAVVYEAVCEEDGRRVALKVLLPHAAQSADLRARFEREARAASRLDHPNIVKVLELRRDGELPFLVMELVEGEDLGTRIRARGGSLPNETEIREHCRWAAEIASALEHAHRQDLLHRDVTPGNIMMAADGEPRLLDFGLTKSLQDGGDGLTLTGKFVGTPYYVAPEQITGGRITLDARADVYSLAACLYEAVTGRVPFPGESPEEVFAGISGREPPPPREANPAVPAGLERVLLRALRKHPGDRHPNAAALRRELLRFSGHASHAERSVSRRARTWLLENPVTATLWSLVAAAAVYAITLQSAPTAVPGERPVEAVAQGGPALRPAVISVLAGPGAALALEREDALGWLPVDPWSSGDEVEAGQRYRLTVRCPGARRWRRELEPGDGEVLELEPALESVRISQRDARWPRTLAFAPVWADLDERAGQEALLLEQDGEGGFVVGCRTSGLNRELWSRSFEGAPLQPPVPWFGEGGARSAAILLAGDGGDVAEGGFGGVRLEVLAGRGGDPLQRLSLGPAAGPAELHCMRGFFAENRDAGLVLQSGRISVIAPDGGMRWQAKLPDWPPGESPGWLATDWDSDGQQEIVVALGDQTLHWFETDGRVVHRVDLVEHFKQHRELPPRGRFLLTELPGGEGPPALAAFWETGGETELVLLDPIDGLPSVSIDFAQLAGDGLLEPVRILLEFPLAAFPAPGAGGGPGLVVSDRRGRLMRLGVVSSMGLLPAQFLVEARSGEWLFPPRLLGVGGGRFEIVGVDTGGRAAAWNPEGGAELWSFDVGADLAFPPAAFDSEGGGSEQLALLYESGEVRYLRPPPLYP